MPGYAVLRTNTGWREQETDMASIQTYCVGIPQQRCLWYPSRFLADISHACDYSLCCYDEVFGELKKSCFTQNDVKIFSMS